MTYGCPLPSQEEAEYGYLNEATLGSDSFHLNPGSDANCVTLDKLLNLSLPQFTHL